MIREWFARAVDPQRRLFNLGIALVCGLLVLVAWRAAPLGNLHTGDTDNLVAGSRVIRRCISDSTFRSCGVVAKNVTTVFPYPLLQYLPAMFLTGVGASDNTAIHLLGRLNFVAFVGMLIIVIVTSRRRESSPQTVRLALIVLLASPLWFFATAAFGEMLSAALFVGLIAAVYCRRHWWVLVLAIGVGISKETMPYFALILGLLVAWPITKRDRRSVPVMVSLATGSVMAVAINFGFNEFRYGQTSNGNYLDPLLRVPDVKTGMKQLVIILFSPNAGVILFWLMLLLPTAIIARVALRYLRERRWIEVARWIGIGAVPLAFFAGLALWFSPFGWITWGPRLEIPILPATAVAVFWMAPSELTVSIFRWLTFPAWRFVVGMILLAGVAVFGVAAPWTHDAAVQKLIEADTSCPALTQVVIQKSAQTYYRCNHHDAWRRPGTVIKATVDPPSGGAVLAQLLCAAACAALFLDTRRLSAGVSTVVSDTEPPDDRVRSAHSADAQPESDGQAAESGGSGRGRSRRWQGAAR